MVVDLSKYDGDSFEAALDVFYGVVDDLKIQAADGRLTLTDLEASTTTRSAATRRPKPGSSSTTCVDMCTGAY